jgi:hypothetical protein
MEKKANYEKPELFAGFAAIRCSLLAGSNPQGDPQTEDGGDDVTSEVNIKPLPKDPNDARVRGGLGF